MKPDSLLYRQIPEKYRGNDGVPTSQAFKPMPKDEGLLSTYNSELISADGSFEHYNSRTAGGSVGVLGVDGAEVVHVGLTSREDPVEFPEHAVIDMSHLTTSQHDRPAKQLRGYAMKRSWLVGPTSSNS
jgi:hypothetical protein